VTTTPTPAPAGPTTIPRYGINQFGRPEPDENGVWVGLDVALALQAELARERRRTASLVKAGDELVQHCFVLCDECYDDSGLGIMLCKACRLMRERWNQAKSALQGQDGAGGTN
jgi:hypothetical protein